MGVHVRPLSCQMPGPDYFISASGQPHDTEVHTSASDPEDMGCPVVDQFIPEHMACGYQFQAPGWKSSYLPICGGPWFIKTTTPRFFLVKGNSSFLAYPQLLCRETSLPYVFWFKGIKINHCSYDCNWAPKWSPRAQTMCVREEVSMTCRVGPGRGRWGDGPPSLVIRITPLRPAHSRLVGPSPVRPAVWLWVEAVFVPRGHFS